MRIPNVSERVKEAPAYALRAVFAGIGQALLLSDRVRRRLAHQPDAGGQAAEHGDAAAVIKIPVTEPRAASQSAPAAPAAPPPAPAKAPTAPPQTVAPRLEAPAAPAPAPAKAPRKAAPKAAAKVAQQTVAPASASPEAAGKPPFPNYDDLSLASLRARLRGLDITAVRQLLSYERAHGSRSDVITMYQRRIEKLEDAAG
jgi:hypothetical protein